MTLTSELKVGSCLKYRWNELDIKRLTVEKSPILWLFFVHKQYVHDVRKEILFNGFNYLHFMLDFNHMSTKCPISTICLLLRRCGFHGSLQWPISCDSYLQNVPLVRHAYSLWHTCWQPQRAEISSAGGYLCVVMCHWATGECFKTDCIVKRMEEIWLWRTVEDCSKSSW